MTSNVEGVWQRSNLLQALGRACMQGTDLTMSIATTNCCACWALSAVCVSTIANRFHESVTFHSI